MHRRCEVFLRQSLPTTVRDVPLESPRPIHFHADLRVDIQALGWMSRRRYRPLHDDIASTAVFYLDRPSMPGPSLPSADDLEVSGEPVEPPR